jgi:hypothetical protein
MLETVGRSMRNQHGWEKGQYDFLVVNYVVEVR